MKHFYRFLIFSVALSVIGVSDTVLASPTVSRGPLSFEEWTVLAGTYVLKNFDSTEVYDGHESKIKVETNRYKSAGGRTLTLLNLKLYDSYSAGSAHILNFGPFKEFGKSSIYQDSTGITYSYECTNEIVVFQGVARTLNLSLEVKQLAETSDLEIQYKIEFPQDIVNSHRFILERSGP